MAGSLAPVQVTQLDSSPGHAHLRHLLTQLAQERDDCQARLDQLQVRLHSQSPLSDSTLILHSQTTLSDYPLTTVHDTMCQCCFVSWNIDLGPHSLQDGTHMSSLLSMSEFVALFVFASLSLHALGRDAASAMLHICASTQLSGQAWLQYVAYKCLHSMLCTCSMYGLLAIQQTYCAQYKNPIKLVANAQQCRQPFGGEHLQLCCLSLTTCAGCADSL